MAILNEIKVNKIYISGAISTDPDYKRKFDCVEKMLKDKGFKVVNPTKHEKLGKTWVHYMKKDIKQMMDCDAIYLIPDYKTSNGAKIEKKLADDLGFYFINGKWEDLYPYGFVRFEKSVD